MRRSSALIPLLAALALPSAVAAQTTTTPAPTPAAQTTPAPEPATLRVATQEVGRDGAVLAKRTWGVVGKLLPAKAGQTVVVRLYRGGKKVVARKARTNAGGQFRVRLSMNRWGNYVVRTTHARSEQLEAAVAKPFRVEVLPKALDGGSAAEAIRAVQRRLNALGYVVGARGRFDARTARAVLAFRKVTGLSRTMSANGAFMAKLAKGAGAYRLRYPSHGKHVEADISRQILVLARGSKVERIYHTSSGAPATPTVRGNYKFYMSQPGLNNKEMYYSQYFIRGYAIHGYKSVPTYGASHGCLRVPLADAKSIYDWIEIGDRMDVYD